MTAFATDTLLQTPAPPVPLATRVRRGVGAAAFMSLWMAAVPLAAPRVVFGRGPLRYDRTPHTPDSPR